MPVICGPARALTAEELEQSSRDSEHLRRRALRTIMQGVEDGLGGFSEDRSEFSIAMTVMSGVSKSQDPQDILEVSLTIKLEPDPDGQDPDGRLGLPEAGYEWQTRKNYTVAGHRLTNEERQSAVALLRPRLADLSQETPADTSGMRSYLGYSIPEQVSHLVATEGGNPWTRSTRSSNRAQASSEVDRDTETSSGSDDDVTEASIASRASSLVKGETGTALASNEDTGSQAGESPSA